MIPTEMGRDQILNFARCLTDNGDNTFTLQTSSGSATGDNFSSSHRSDIMKAFDKTIDNGSVRVF